MSEPAFFQQTMRALLHGPATIFMRKRSLPEWRGKVGQTQSLAGTPERRKPMGLLPIYTPCQILNVQRARFTLKTLQKPLTLPDLQGKTEPSKTSVKPVLLWSPACKQKMQSASNKPWRLWTRRISREPSTELRWRSRGLEITSNSTGVSSRGALSVSQNEIKEVHNDERKWINLLIFPPSNKQ